MTIEYFILKSSTNKVLQFTREYVDMHKIDLRTSIGEDLSLWELDGYLFLDNFQEKFDIKLPEKVYDYVCPSNLKLNFIHKVVYFPIYILSIPLFILIYPFLKNERKESVRKKIKMNKHRLTLGDLAITLAVGKFVKREDVNIKF